MKTNILAVCGAALLLAGSVAVYAGEQATSKQGSPEFERLKTLVGTWTERRTWARGRSI